VFSDPHVQARGMRVKVNHPFEPDLSLCRNALTLFGTPITNYRYPPRLGEHTKEILSSKLGYDDAKLDALRAQKII
jgi:crotonobetainyl-CoA:carnitine CoA-transferase CaiB-like acyl-CoA transferase